ncbi:MAG: hypothetical protein JNG85_12640, partial [Spirochaetaceae bacterium]|nr:hypothetical protein [Spirochaetaceae bacterium]
EELYAKGRLDQYEYVIRRPGGELRNQIVSSRFIDYLGEACIVSLVVDVTPLKQAEAELKALNAELEAKVTLRTEDLADANLELQAANAELARALEELKDAQSKILVSEKLAALGRLTAGIAHELNTPLAAIAASARFELKTLGEGLDELFRAAARLPEEALELVRLARDTSLKASASPLTADPPAERRARREAEAALAAAGVGDTELFAEQLVELGLSWLAPRAAPFLAGADGPDFLQLLRGVIGAYRAARVTEDAVAKASRVVAALRTYSRGGEDEAPTVVELGPQLRSIVDLYYNQTKRGIELAIDIPTGLAVFARREAIARIWFNLLNNAVQAVGESGRIEVSAEAAGDGELLVSIRDSGPGIPEDLKRRIFEPFFTTKAAGEGTGLGLDIARRLARADGGDISFESEPGRTIFTVRLPAAIASNGSPA